MESFYKTSVVLLVRLPTICLRNTTNAYIFPKNVLSNYFFVSGETAVDISRVFPVGY